MVLGEFIRQIIVVNSKNMQALANGKLLKRILIIANIQAELEYIALQLLDSQMALYLHVHS